MTDVERAAFVLAHPAATYTIPIPLPPMATVGDDLDGYCEEDALSEADALDSAVDVEMSRLPDGRYTFGVPIVPDVGAVLLPLGEALDMLRDSLLEGCGVTLTPDVEPLAESPIAGAEDA